jgi:cytochrome b6-f complex iron-sulfur subunit
MTDKKPSTADIMAMLRKKPGAEAPAPAAEAAPAAPPPVAAEAVGPAAEAPAPAAPAAKPKGTADIMAAIRAKGTAPAAAPAAPAAGGAPAAKPKGTSDIMAAIRAKGAAPAGAAPAAAAPAAAVAPKAAAPVATGKSPAEMIQAMRAQAAGVAPAATAEPAKPKLPAKPAPAAGKAGAKAEQPRRSFFGALCAALCTPYYMAWTTLSVIGGFWGLGIARFMMPNTVLELPSKFKVGSIGDYPLGTVSEKYKAARAVWIVHTDSYDGQNLIYALLSVCTHLGCTPSWLDAEQKFKCPCHGSGFYINGINFEGPAPRPLERLGLTLGADGVLEVDKSIKFQEELGQWSDPKSFVKVS